MSLYGSCKSIGAWGSDNIYMSGQANIPDMQSARRDMVTGSVVVAAIVMFIWTGGSAMSAVVRRLTGLGAGVEQIIHSEERRVGKACVSPSRSGGSPEE